MPAKKNAFPSFMDRGNGYLNPMGFALSRKNKGDYFVMPLACIIFAPVMKKILFVCLGNICRSCAAEEIMRKLAADAGRGDEFVLDSAGLISYHEGEQADARMRAHAARRGYRITHLSRPVRYQDFFDFDLIIGMDDRNISRLKALAPGLEEEKKVARMTDFCRLKVVDHVPDPYYGGDTGFENVLDILEDACAGLLARLAGGC